MTAPLFRGVFRRRPHKCRRSSELPRRRSSPFGAVCSSQRLPAWTSPTDDGLYRARPLSHFARPLGASRLRSFGFGPFGRRRSSAEGCSSSRRSPSGQCGRPPTSRVTTRRGGGEEEQRGGNCIENAPSELDSSNACKENILCVRPADSNTERTRRSVCFSSLGLVVSSVTSMMHLARKPPPPVALLAVFDSARASILRLPASAKTQRSHSSLRSPRHGKG